MEPRVSSKKKAADDSSSKEAREGTRFGDPARWGRLGPMPLALQLMTANPRYWVGLGALFGIGSVPLALGGVPVVALGVLLMPALLVMAIGGTWVELHDQGRAGFQVVFDLFAGRLRDAYGLFAFSLVMALVLLGAMPLSVAALMRAGKGVVPEAVALPALIGLSMLVGLAGFYLFVAVLFGYQQVVLTGARPLSALRTATWMLRGRVLDLFAFQWLCAFASRLGAALLVGALQLPSLALLGRSPISMRVSECSGPGALVVCSVLGLSTCWVVVAWTLRALREQAVEAGR